MNKTVKNWIKRHSSEVISYCGLLGCIIFFSIATPLSGESIWSASKLATLFADVIVLAMISVGAIFVYALGCMDISLGKQVGVYATIMVMVGNATGSLLLAIIICIIVTVFIGAVNGSMGELLHIPSIIPSLVFMMVLGGVSSIIYVRFGSRNANLTAIDTHIFKSPWLMFVVLLIEVLIVTFLFNYTKLGKYAKAIGANPVVAEQNGIHIIRYKMYAYIILGLCVVGAAVFQMGYTGSASDSTGTGLEMKVMVALILGGMPLSGGMKSKVSCAVVGSFTYAFLDIGLPIIGVPANVILMIRAIIFILIVLFTCRQKDDVLPR